MRHPPAQQRPPERFQIREPAQEHGDVAAAHRPRPAVVVVHALRSARRKKRGDAGGNHFRLRLDSSARHVEQFRAGVRRSGLADRRQRVVRRERRVERRSGRRERAPEDEIGELHQRGPGTPGFPQHEPVRAPREQPAGIGLRSGDVGSAEVVDRLFAVADDEDRGRQGVS